MFIASEAMTFYLENDPMNGVWATFNTSVATLIIFQSINRHLVKMICGWILQ